MIKKYKGFLIFVGGIVFNLIESLYFGIGTKLGFNKTPQSVAEFVCDDIALIIMMFGIYVMYLKISKKDKEI